MKQEEQKKPKPNLINIVASGTDWTIKTKHATLKNKPAQPKQIVGES